MFNDTIPSIPDGDIFSIIGMGSQEIKHSNVIAWMLYPYGTHGCKDRFMKNLCKYFGFKINDDTSFMDLQVIREKACNIDLLLVSKSNRLVVCIENKVHAPLSNGQLDKYYDYVNREYKRFTKIFIYLTPKKHKNDSKKAESFTKWKRLSYEKLITALYYTVFTDSKNHDGQIQLLPSSGMAQLFVLSYIKLMDKNNICDVPPGWLITADHFLNAIDDEASQALEIRNKDMKIRRLENINEVNQRTIKNRMNFTSRGHSV